MHARRVIAYAALALASGCAPPTIPRHAAPAAETGTLTQQAYVVIESSQADAVLVKDDPDGGRVCEAPCRRKVTLEKDKWYSILAPDTLPTSPFQMYSRQDDVVWIEHRPVSPATIWGLRGATIATATAGVALLISAAVLAATDEPSDDTAENTRFALGISGLVVGLPIAGLFGILTAVYSDSGAKFKDPSQPGFTF